MEILSELDKVILGRRKPRIGYEQGFHDGFVEAMKVARETILIMSSSLNCMENISFNQKHGVCYSDSTDYKGE